MDFLCLEIISSQIWITYCVHKIQKKKIVRSIMNDYRNTRGGISPKILCQKFRRYRRYGNRYKFFCSKNEKRVVVRNDVVSKIILVCYSQLVFEIFTLFFNLNRRKYRKQVENNAHVLSSISRTIFECYKEFHNRLI
jgi:hypothetical protein